MKEKLLSLISIFTVLAVFLFSSACPNLKNHYAIDSLPGCDDCPGVLDEETLDELVNKIEDGDYGNIHSLIIIHNDSLALEEYFGEWSRDMLHACFSVTKSVTSALLGIALDQDKIDGVEGKLLNYFPEYNDIKNFDERKESITLKHLLTMTAGFTWNETNPPYLDSEGNPNLENDAIKLHESRDWMKHILDLPMSDNPGTKWNYNSGCTILLSGIIAKETGQSAEEFAKENLFSKIGITNWEWDTSLDGITNTGWGLQLHPVDMAMFGYLFLNNGLLHGEQIVSENWVNESTRKHMSIYGYHWYVLPDGMIKDHPEAHDIFYATGYGGQHIMIVPSINMVIVTTAENFAGHGGALFDMLFDYILLAVKDK